MTGPIEPGLWGLAGAAVLLLLNGGLSVAMGLGLERRLAVAAVRATVQLALLALILEPVFEWAHPGVVLAVCVFMVLVAARESVRRVEAPVSGMLGSTALAMGVGALGTALWATVVLLQVEPWYEPRYLIPLVGMILGNALTGTSLAMDRTTRILRDQREAVEALLACGASRSEALRPVLQDALRTGLIPIMNTMSAVGVVTIPGMMTGQILGGTDPGLAARYQLLILFLIAAATAAAAGISAVAVAYRLVDAGPRLRADRRNEDRDG